MTRTVEIVEPFGNCHLACAGRFEREQSDRVELSQRHVFGQLELALVVFVIRHLHPFDIQIKRFTREQAFAPAVPIVEFHKVLSVHFGAHQFLFHRPLGSTRGVEREAIVLVVEPRNLALHPQIKIFVGELVVEELVHFLCVLDLLLNIEVLVVRDLLRDQRGEYLPSVLHQLVRSEVVLEYPLVGPALVARPPRRHACLFLIPCSDNSQDSCGSLERFVDCSAHWHGYRWTDTPKV